MELVINIDEKQYEDICHNAINYKNTVSDGLLKAISLGTVLPKNHGKLIDINDVCGEGECKNCFHCDICEAYNAPTILKSTNQEGET